MYLLPTGMVPRVNRKLTGLGALRRIALRPDLGRLRGYRLRGLGDAQDPNAIDPLTGETFADESVPGSPAALNLQNALAEATAALTPTPPPASQPQGPVQIPDPLANIRANMQNSQSPLDYVSPQAAIAAGLNSQVVYAAWAQGLARYPTQQAAIAAGIPAGVVTQLWGQSRQSVPPASTSFFDQAPLGIANKYLIAAGAGLFALVSLKGGRR